MGYYGLMWIGELVAGQHTLKAQDVHVASNKNKILLILYSSKTHDKESHPQKIKISESKTQMVAHRRQVFFCLFKTIRDYISVRGTCYRDANENFFVLADKSLVTQPMLRNILRKLLIHLNLDSSLYSIHSMHLGRAGDLLKAGYNIEQIKQIGRWKSNAVYKYLKLL